MEKKDEFILVFDSGLGGLSVLRELVKELPKERFLYLGDSRNAPYGTRPTEQVRHLTMEALKSQMHKGVKAIVIACNTVTATSIVALREAYPDKVVIGTEPALKLAAERHPGGRIAVLATNVTLAGEKFKALMDRFSNTHQVMPIPCPGLVEFVERGDLDSQELRNFLASILEPVRKDGLDAVVLGCTHYPFVAPVIRELVGPQTEVLDGGPGIAHQTRRRLEEEGLLRGSGEGAVEICNSLGAPEILALSKQLLNLK